MYPDIDSMACFVAAAKTLNFRSAAHSVALTPAALGKRIAQLEDQFNCRLFDRTTRRVTLTVAGQALLPKALRLLECASECSVSARGHTGPVPVQITIGTRHELGMSWILPMLSLLKARLPHLDINLYFGSGPDLEERVKSFDIQCAVTSRVFTDPVFDVLRLVREDYVFVGAPHLLESMPLSTAADALKHTIVDVQPGQPLFRYFRDADAAPDPIRFGRQTIMGTTAAVRALILDGAGVGVLPLYLIKADLDTAALVPIFPKVKLRFDHFRLMYRHDDPRASLYAAIADVMREQELV